MYTFFKLKTAQIISELSQRQISSGKTEQHKGTNVLTLINLLRLICDHGEHLLPSSAVEVWKSRSNSLNNWQMMQVFRARCDICGLYVDEVNAPASMDLEYQCEHLICPQCAIRGQKDKAYAGLSCPKCINDFTSEADTIPPNPRAFIQPSAKVEKLIQNLRQEQLSELEGDLNLPRKR